MPINQLTRSAQFPEIGRLRKGDPKGTDRPGRDLTYFRFDTPDPALAKLFTEVYGPTPVAVKVYMPYADLGQCWAAWREHRNKTVVHHRCDGDLVWEYHQGTLVQTDTPCPTRDLDDRDVKGGKNPAKCQPVGRLSMIVRGLNQFGYVLLPTTSILDIIRIDSELKAIASLPYPLHSIPLVLRRKMEDVSTPMGESRSMTKKAMVHIGIDPDWAFARLQAMDDHAMLAARSGGALPAPAMPQLAAPIIIQHGAYDVDTATGEVMNDDDDSDDDEATEIAYSEELLVMSVDEIKAAWRVLQARGVKLSDKAWAKMWTDVDSYDEAMRQKATAWIVEQETILDAS